MGSGRRGEMASEQVNDGYAQCRRRRRRQSSVITVITLAVIRRQDYPRDTVAAVSRRAIMNGTKGRQMTYHMTPPSRR